MDSVDALPGIMRTPSGLRYQIVTPADGDIPEEDDTVQVAYIGLHADGTSFWQADNEAFPLRGTIRGFREGVGMMAVGSTYKLYIPSALGYPHKGYPDLIQPNEPLIYEVTLKGAY
jgi:FKBP-type peptidyl-prolyl cis-trans isomerase